MAQPEVGEFSEAIAALRSVDTLAIPLGPGAPGGLLHALGDSTPADRFDDLRVFGALLPDLYSIFTRPSVHLKSG
ncbi:MAG: 4-hydroxybutyrate CoA-transferase, partial [Ilumatobacteraceae bacterium]